MARTVALVLAAIGGAVVHAALLSNGMWSNPLPDAGIYYLAVACVAFVNAGLFASVNAQAN